MNNPKNYNTIECGHCSYDVYFDLRHDRPNQKFTCPSCNEDSWTNTPGKVVSFVQAKKITSKGRLVKAYNRWGYELIGGQKPVKKKGYEHIEELVCTNCRTLLRLDTKRKRRSKKIKCSCCNILQNSKVKGALVLDLCGSDIEIYDYTKREEEFFRLLEMQQEEDHFYAKRRRQQKLEAKAQKERDFQRLMDFAFSEKRYGNPQVDKDIHSRIDALGDPLNAPYSRLDSPGDPLNAPYSMTREEKQEFYDKLEKKWGKVTGGYW